MVGRVRVNEITAPDGLSAVAAPYGVKFNNNATSDANTLDWYQEGTFVPAIVGGTVAGTCSYSSQGGKFTRIGRTVHIQARCDYTGHNGSGLIYMTLPLPFSLSGDYPIFVMSSGFSAPIVGYLNTSLQSLLFYNQSSPTAGNWNTPTFVTSAGIIINGVLTTA